MLHTYNNSSAHKRMKREADAEMGPSQKRTRSGDDVDVRLLIPSKAAGSVIGKGGHNITKLRTEYKASVTVPDCPGPERILTVVAGVDTAIEVIEEVIPCLEDSRGGGGGGRSDEVDLRMLVHQSQAGCIIGKSGFKIKELREKTGARIRIYSDCCPQSTDRVVQIQGRASTCVDCLREIIGLVRNSPVKGINNPYDPHNFDEFYAVEYGGYGDPSGKSGGGGGGGGRGGPSMRGMGVPPPMGGRGGNRFGPGGMGGPPPGGMGMGGRGGMRGGMNSDGGGYGYGGGPPGGRNMPSSRGGFASGRAGYGGGEEHSEWAEDTAAQNLLASGPKTSTQVTIPKDLAGAIIGKGGARIRKIRSDSGAGITIDEPLPGSNDRVITITGTSNQIQMAQYLLQQSCESSNKNHN
ncbi:hypothetical protein B566_EDAN009406 [Ephemera danica]|nr:hypothetical protein B566_EDAN009406 [Ephemera danica]